MVNIERFVLRPLAVVSVAYAMSFGIDVGVKSVEANGPVPCKTPVAGKTSCDSDKQLADAKATQTAFVPTQTAIAATATAQASKVADLEAQRVQTPTPSSSFRIDKDGTSINIDINNNITIPSQYMYGPDKVVMTREELDKFIKEGAKTLLEAEKAKVAQATPSPKPYVPSPTSEVITKVITNTVTVGDEHLLPWEPGFAGRTAAIYGAIGAVLGAILWSNRRRAHLPHHHPHNHIPPAGTP